MAGLAFLVLLRLGCPENEADERGREKGANEDTRDNVECDLDFTHGLPRFPWRDALRQLHREDCSNLHDQLGSETAFRSS